MEQEDAGSPLSSNKPILKQQATIESIDLHKLCRSNKLKKIQEVVATLDHEVLVKKLAAQKGVLGYTVLHEAVASGNTDILDYLLEVTNAVTINSRAKSGYTPLHMAATDGRVESVRILLKHNADVSCVDEFGRTPRFAAKLSSKDDMEKLLFSEELIKELEVKENGGRFASLLQDKESDRLLAPNCLERALVVATRKDNDHFVGLLVDKGAKNTDECLRVAIREGKPKARALFLLIEAAKNGDTDFIKILYKDRESDVERDYFKCDDHGLREVQDILQSGRISTIVPMKLAHSFGQAHARELLLMKTHVSKETCYIRWNGLQLLKLEESWLRKIPWVRILLLASNGFETIPSEIGTYLTKVVKIHLQNNLLTVIPQSLLKLPNLEDLNLSHNKLRELPEVAEWSPCLLLLDLSNNLLSSINPKQISAPALRSLSLARNKLPRVPLCVCSFTSLQTLDLSDNSDIIGLPTEMGQLSSLFELRLDGLNNIIDPPKSIRNDPVSCIRYLNNKRRCTQRLYRMKLMLVGCANRGKTTLVACLQGRRCRDESTVGVDISEWSYRSSFGRPKFHFSIWDFGGQEEYYATHQCFLSQESLYLLLFNLKHGREGVKEIQPWLNNLALRVPRSCVIVVGTHLDEMRCENVAGIFDYVRTVAEPFQNKLQIVDVLAVGLKNDIRNVGALKNAIYNYAANYKNSAGIPIMGRSIPACYHALDKRVRTLQQEVRQGSREPVMHYEEFREIVYKMKLPDIQDEEELKTATLFLTDIGTLLHYDDRRHNLHELYFIDPRWLCDMMATVVTVKERNPFVKQGILQTKHLPFLFKDDRFLRQYFNQYLTLLDQFEIAIPLSHDKLLVPSMLPEEIPDELKNDDLGEPMHSRHIIFTAANTPPGFWSRLLSRIMHLIPGISTVQQAATVGDNSDVKLNSLCVKTIPEGNSSPRRRRLASSEQSPGGSCPPLNFGDDDIRLNCWRTGLVYEGNGVKFRIETLSHSARFRHQSKEGVLITACDSSCGKTMMCQLIDVVVQLVDEWYSGLKDRRYGSTGLEQRVPCFECTKLGRAHPHEFEVQECLTHHLGDETVTCRYFDYDISSNHDVLLTDIIPDALLQDIDPKFILDTDEIDYQEDECSFLGSGGYGKVYKGICRGKAVAVKVFTAENNATAFHELRSEVKLLQHLHHPSLVCLIGVSVSLKALVLEEAPLKSLEHSLLEKRVPIHRVTVFRIAAQVAAALRFLHSHGIIFRDLKASNVLLWTLDPDSLCHCKISDFGIAARLPVSGTRGQFGTRGFMAPEVLSVSRCSTYDERADIFSFSMFLYQLITRRYPSRYHPLQGERPKLRDVSIAHSGYHCLTQLMIECWNEDPRKRPSTEQIIKRLSSSTTQAVMCVASVKTQLSLRQGIIVPQSAFEKAGHTNKAESDLWICCDGLEGMEMNVYNMHTKAKLTNQPYFKENQFSCMALCRDHVWMCSRAGVDYGVIDILSIDTHKSIHSIQMSNVFISCITATDEAVYVGTNKGYCLSFPAATSAKKAVTVEANMYKRVSKNCIKGLACTHDCLWVSQATSIILVSYDDLEITGKIHREEESENFVGELALTGDKNTVWSAHIGSSMISAWDTRNRCHLFDVCIRDHIHHISSVVVKDKFIITAMTPALDTMWVGTASGHILIFHNQQLVTWYQPYRNYVCFLSCAQAAGPNGTEKCIVASGGKSPHQLDFGERKKERTGGERDTQMSKMLIFWEAYEAKMVQQVKMVEENSPGYLENHTALKRMISDGKFTDGTSIV